MMGIFDFLKGNKKDQDKQTQETSTTDNKVGIYNPVKGEVVDIEQVDDPVFSQKMMGDGFGVRPANGDMHQAMVK